MFYRACPSLGNAQRRTLFYIVLFVVIAVTAWRMRMETELPLFFLATEQESDSLVAGSLQSGEFSRRYLLAINQRNGQAAVKQFTAALARELNQQTDVMRVWSTDQPPMNIKAQAQTYAKHAHQIYSLTPEHDIPKLFTGDGLTKRAAHLKQMLLSPQSFVIKDMARHDPLLLTLDVFKRLSENFTSSDAADSLFRHLILESRVEAFDIAAQRELQRSIESRFQKLNRIHGGRFQLEMTGVPLFTVRAHDQIQDDVRKVTLVSCLGVILVFLLVFRSLKALYYTGLILIATVSAGTLATLLIFGRIHGLTLALGITLIGICIDYPVHVMVHHGASQAKHPEVVVLRIWPSLLLGGLTTVIGYLALGLTGYPGFQQIAVFAIFGILSALITTRYVLPALLGNAALRRPNVLGIGHWMRYCQQHRLGLKVAVGVAALAAAFLIPRLEWLDDLEKLSGTLQELKLRDQTIRSRVSSIEAGRMIIIQADDIESTLQRSEEVLRKLEKLRTKGTLDEFHGLYPWLVSNQLQQRNQKVFGQYLTPQHHSDWRAALVKQDLSAEKLGHILPRADTPLVPEQVLASPVKVLLANQIVQRPNDVISMVWLGAHKPNALQSAMQGLEGVRYFSQRDLINRLAQGYRDKAMITLSAGLGIILLILSIRYRRITTAVQVILPALLAILFIFGFWAATQQSISFLHLIGALLAIAICVDYGIFFSENRAKNAALTYQAMGASMLTTVTAFSALSLAANPVLKTLSMAVTLGVIIGFLLCPMIIEPNRKR